MLGSSLGGEISKVVNFLVAFIKIIKGESGVFEQVTVMFCDDCGNVCVWCVCVSKFDAISFCHEAGSFNKVILDGTLGGGFLEFCNGEYLGLECFLNIDDCEFCFCLERVELSALLNIACNVEFEFHMS